VSALAREFGVGPARLRRVAQEVAGLTPGALLARERAAAAAVLARHGDLDAEEIAPLLGLPSAAAVPVPEPDTLSRQAHAATRVFLPARPPFAHEALANFFRTRCMTVVEAWDETDGEPGYRRAWRTENSSGTATFRLLPDGVLVELEGRGRLPVRDLIRRARRMFDLEAPVEAVSERLGADPLLAEAVAAEPGRRVPGAWDPFELAVRAVLGQQVSVAAARTHADRLLALLGVEGPDALFPSPVMLAEADLSGLAMPAARRETIRTLAAAVADGTVDLQGEGDSIRAALVALRGIGPWTADYVAMRGLGDRDAFPAGDLVVRQALAGGSRKLPSEASVRARAETWRPVRAYAALHLWATLGAGG
jgi:AraC family transcriptional regulator of adaptative response / DNA-3-methyladenine glycosylase II